MSKTKKGFTTNIENCQIDIKYSKQAEKKELIRFTVKEGNTFEINADALLALIASQFKSKEFALALADTDVANIYMVETERYINATLDRDFKKGERISFPFKHMYPYVLAAVEKAYHIADHDGKVKEVPREVFEQTLKNLGDINKEFIETLYKKEITSK